MVPSDTIVATGVTLKMVAGVEVEVYQEGNINLLESNTNIVFDSAEGKDIGSLPLINNLIL